MAPPGFEAARAVAGLVGIVAAAVEVCLLLGIVVVPVEVWPPREIVAVPEILVGAPEMVVVTAFVVSNPGHPTFAASPNACSFASCSSSLEVVEEVYAGSSIAVLPSDDPCSHSSNLTESRYKRMAPFDSRPNLSHSAVSDTSALPMDATTSRCRKRGPRPSQAQHRHKSRESRPLLAVQQIRRVGGEIY